MNRRKFLNLSMTTCIGATALAFPSNQLWADGISSNTPTPETWVAFGDSITEGMTYPLWLSQSLAKAGKPTPVWINAGIGGNTAAQMLERMDRDVLAYKPDRVFFCCGVNDVNEKRTDYNQNVEAIFGKLKKAGIPCVVISTISVVGPPAVINPQLKVMNQFLKEQARHFGFQFADVFTPFEAATQAGRELHEPDHIHLSKDGYEVFVTNVLKAIFPGVPLSTPLEPPPELGLIPEWKVSVLDNPAKNWDIQVPESTPIAFWWKDQERKRGFVVNLKDKAPEAKGFVAQGSLHLTTGTAILLKVGGQVTALSIDGNPLPLYPTNHTWGIRDGARTPVLSAGDHVIQIKTDGDAFFVSAQPIPAA